MVSYKSIMCFHVFIYSLRALWNLMLRAIWTDVRLLSGTTANRFGGQRMKHAVGSPDSFLQDTRSRISRGSQLCGSISLKNSESIESVNHSFHISNSMIHSLQIWCGLGHFCLCYWAFITFHTNFNYGLVSSLQWGRVSPEA